MFGPKPNQSFTTRRPVLVAGGLVVAVVLALLPARLADAVRAAVSVALLPTQRGLVSLRQAGERTISAVGAQFAGAESKADRELDYQRLVEENERLKAELEAVHGQVSLLAHRDSDDSSLLASQCISARVLGGPAQAYLSRQRLLDAGQADGVQADALALRPATPLVDRGTQAGVGEGNVVLAGSRVWGKVVSAGSHTSTVCPITEPGYRDLVRLASLGADGHSLRFGAKGILEGTGESAARLRMIEITEPVAEGDLVYSLAGQGFVELPLLCGRVVRVERPQGAGHWEIWVAPAIEGTPDDLAILCPTVAAPELARRPDRPDSE